MEHQSEEEEQSWNESGMYEEEQPPNVGRHLTCVIHRIRLAPKVDNTKQRHTVFRT